MEINTGKESGIAAALGLALLMIASPALAQTSSPTATHQAEGAENEDADAIVVVGDNGKRYTLSSDRLKSAVRVFTKFSPSLAPQATLWFKVRPRGDTAPNDPEFWLEKKNERINIVLGPDRRFSLPHATILKGGWVLRSNQPRSLELIPYVASPGTNFEDRRFGDLRLQCRVMWELMPEVNGPLRIMGDAWGVCTSKSVAIYYSVDKPLQSASVIQPGRSEVTLPLDRDNKGYRPLLHDKKISNEARIRLTYR